MDVTKLSKQELENLSKEIDQQRQKIKEQELKEYKEEVKAKIEKLRMNKDLLLGLIKHSRTSCSDDNVCNGYGSADYGARCAKCHLIEILNDEWLDGDFDIEIDVTITKVYDKLSNLPT